MREYAAKVRQDHHPQRGPHPLALNRSQSPRPPLAAGSELKSLNLAKPNQNFLKNSCKNEQKASCRIGSGETPTGEVAANNLNPISLNEIRETGKSVSSMSISTQKQIRNNQRSPTSPKLNQLNQEMSGNNLEPTYLQNLGSKPEHNVHMASTSKISVS